MFPSGKNSSAQSQGKHNTKKNVILFSAFLALFLVVLITTIKITQSQNNEGSSSSSNNSYMHPVVKSTCASTLYPDLCISSIANAPGALASSIKSPSDVIMTALNRTISNAQHNYHNIRSITFSRITLTKREKVALQDCLQMINDSVEELHKTTKQFLDYENQSKNYSISQHAEDLLTLLSAAMTNQETCLEGFSHSEVAKKFRSKIKLEVQQMLVFRLCSNVLAMIKNLIGIDVVNRNPKDVKTNNSQQGWPKWLSAGDRRLLQATTVTPDAVVAADGSGNYRTISAAVAAAPDRSSRRYVIKIKAGVYRENVEVPKEKTNLMFIGDGQKITIVTASRSVGGGSTTFNSATVAVAANGFLARDITFQNTAGPGNHQAVALRVNADLTAFYRCDMIAYQDTLYVHSLRQFYVKCIIIGTVDFIFGNAAAIFQDCDIHARRPNPGQKNMVTAQGRDDPNQNTGIVIQKCRIGATADLQAAKSSFPTYLGRPWKMYSRTVIMQTQISDVINPAGWFEWNGNFALDTLYYAEYQNTGAGAGTANRVKWKGYHVLTSPSQVQMFTAANFISGSNWLPATGFPFSLGL